MKKFKASLLALGMSATCFSGIVGAELPAGFSTAWTDEMQLGDDVWQLAYEEGIGNGKSAKWAEIYADIKSDHFPNPTRSRWGSATEWWSYIEQRFATGQACATEQAFNFANAYIDAIERNKTEQWAVDYAIAKAFYKWEDEEATVYATQLELQKKAGKSDDFAHDYTHNYVKAKFVFKKSSEWAGVYADIRTRKEKEIRTEKADLMPLHLNCEAFDAWLDAYATAKADNKEEQWSINYADAYKGAKIFSEKSEIWSTHYATAVADGKTDEWAKAYAYATEKGQSDVWLHHYESVKYNVDNEWAIHYASARTDGKSHEWSVAFANERYCGKSYYWATDYATKIEEGKSREWAFAYASAKATGYQDDWAVNCANIYADARISGKSHEWAVYYTNAIANGKTSEFAIYFATQMEAGRSLV